ncbi:MAG: hypothetical protein JKY69_05900, partial [Flavobacteriaceae bacterium]|nr:hypothetical protein [Flavobacteriaceae bacterium]
MNKTLESLPNDPKVLQAMYLAAQQQLLDLNEELQNKEHSIQARDATIEQLREQLALLLSKRFQSQS